MEIITMPIGEVIPYEKNPRNNDSAVKYVAESINEFGWKQPIVIDSDNVVIAGHTRLKAAIKLGLEEVPCIIADDLTDEQVKAYRLADNKVAEQAEWDFDLLTEELDGIFDIDMEGFGFELALTDEGFGTDFTLDDSEKSDIVQWTFTLHEEQKELIAYAIGLVKDNVAETFGNTNSNGNALYEVVRQWAEQKK